jgi:hypothetical protein
VIEIDLERMAHRRKSEQVECHPARTIAPLGSAGPIEPFRSLLGAICPLLRTERLGLQDLSPGLLGALPFRWQTLPGEGT